jgi:hypothetical protein
LGSATDLNGTASAWRARAVNRSISTRHTPSHSGTDPTVYRTSIRVQGCSLVGTSASCGLALRARPRTGGHRRWIGSSTVVSPIAPGPGRQGSTVADRGRS